jgi:hypothetical protein
MKSKIFYWTPRALAILTILFMMMFSFDVFESNMSFSDKLLGFLMHNIPLLILISILTIAWKWEVAGGILMIAAFIAASIFYRSFSGNPASLIVISPVLVTGILFIIHGMLKNRKR